MKPWVDRRNCWRGCSRQRRRTRYLDPKEEEAERHPSLVKRKEKQTLKRRKTRDAGKPSPGGRFLGGVSLWSRFSLVGAGITHVSTTKQLKKLLWRIHERRYCYRRWCLWSKAAKHNSVFEQILVQKVQKKNMKGKSQRRRRQSL